MTSSSGLSFCRKDFNPRVGLACTATGRNPTSFCGNFDFSQNSINLCKFK